MDLSPGDVLKDGINRVTATNGLMFIGLFTIVGVLGVVLLNSLLAATGAMADDPAVSHPVIQEIGAAMPAIGIGIVWLALIAVSASINIAALRTFVSGERDVIPTTYFKHNIAFAVANLIIGGVLFAAGMLVGLLLLVIPGIFLAVSLWFFDVYIAVEDENFLDAFAASWHLTSGHRFSLFLIGLGVILIGVVVDLAFTPVHALVSAGSALQPTGLTAELVSMVPQSIGLVVTYATTAAAYNALNEDT